MIKLTDEQRKVAEDNHNLIYHFLHKNHLDAEEWYGLISIGYCKAIATYKPNKGFSLSTYCYSCMLNECLQYKRMLNAESRACMAEISLDANVSEDCDEPLHAIIPSKICVEDEVIGPGVLKDWLAAQSKRDLEILHYRTYMTQKEIAEKLGRKQSNISKILAKLKNSYNKFILGEV